MCMRGCSCSNPSHRICACHWHAGGVKHSKADVRFLEYEEAPQDPSLFIVPDDYEEGTLDMLDGGDDDD
jgi:hypothetical protein